MALSLYMNHNVHRAITSGVRLRGVDVMTAYEDRSHLLHDPELLDRAQRLGRVLFTRDDDLLKEAVRRQREGVRFGGVIYAHQLHVSIGTCINNLEMIAKVGTPDDVVNVVHYLPL